MSSPDKRFHYDGARHESGQLTQPNCPASVAKVRFFEQVSVRLKEIKPHPLNARTHSKKQILQIENAIKAFGFTSPLITDEHHVILAGHARFAAAQNLGLSEVPSIVVAGLSDTQKRALLLADNRIAQSAGWDREQLVAELETLPELLITEGLDFAVTGFEPAEIDALITDFSENEVDPADYLDAASSSVLTTTKRGDLWQLGKHLLLCGDARDPDDMNLLMGSARAHAAFLDPPYNVAIKGIVGRGSAKHSEFAMASGEMTSAAFVEFLNKTLGQAANFSAEGAVHFVCMDWRHIEELLVAAKPIYGAVLNIAVWVKSNAGQGSFYRSQYELVGIFRVGDSPHLNNIELGRHGRSRSNVWKYAGANTFRAGRMEDLRAHPTVKPVGLVADAIKDCTRRNQIILDTFCGSGTTLLAAEKVGRCARAMELEPRYVDEAVRRWQAFSGKDGLHVQSGLTFEEVSRKRNASAYPLPDAVVENGNG